MDNSFKVGSVVIAKRGRDAGKHFVVTQVVDADFVLMVDGQTRKFVRPKKKNVKHLKYVGQDLDNIAEKLIAGKKVFDSEVRSALRIFNQAEDTSNPNHEEGGKYVEG